MIRNNDYFKKEVQVISTYFYPVLAGLEINILNTYSYFSKMGWDVSIFTTKDNVTEKNIYKNVEELNSIKINRYNYLSYSILPFTLGLNYRSRGIIAMHDFVTFPDIFICFFTWILKLLKLKNYTLILTSHGLLTYSFNGIYPGFLMKIKTLIDKYIGVFIINRSVDAIRTVSAREKNNLIRAGIKTKVIEVIGNGIEDIAFDKNLEGRVSAEMKELVSKMGDYILEVARIDRLKNIDTLIKAMSYIKNLKLVIIGSNNDLNYKKELVQIINSNELHDKVIFLGEIKGADKYYIMKKAFVFVHIPHAEGFGNVVHEAMSQGCICIVSQDTALEELIKNGDNGFTVDSSNPNLIAKAISHVYDMPDRKSIQGKNISITRGHSWTHTAERVRDFYINSLI
jgi:glycosyltransferase involved in cell wall biosynthesis